MGQLLSHLRDADMMAQSPEERRMDRGMVGVQLPWVDVDDSVPSFSTQVPEKRIRQQ